MLETKGRKRDSLSVRTMKPLSNTECVVDYHSIRYIEGRDPHVSNKNKWTVDEKKNKPETFTFQAQSATKLVVLKRDKK